MTGLYMHFPFCIKKCAYCDFISFENQQAEGERYIAALLSEMEAYRGEKIDTVYMGGGTPTALPPHLLIRALDGAKSCFSVSPDAEITVEVNPGTCDAAGFKALKEAGVNRISLGVQSFVDEELRLLGRIHSAKEAEQAVLSIHDAGIFNVSLDFMFAIPLQTEESLLYSLNKAVALSPTHLSCYSLTLSDETPLAHAVAKGNICVPDDETDRKFYHTLLGFLEKNGYMRYEISNFAKPGFAARHNTKYWQREPYIGLGLAAHSFFGGVRYENPSSFTDYYARAEHKIKPEGTRINTDDAMSEFIFLGLRQTRAGISRKSFYRAFGQELDTRFAAPIQKLCSFGLLVDDGESLRLTERGIDVSNSVFCEFL